MRDLMRETAFGRIVHFASRGQVFPSAEQLDPSKLDKYREANPALAQRTSIESDANVIDGTLSLEKGKDVQLVDWEQNDREVSDASRMQLLRVPKYMQNPRNWSTAKKVFVTFQICFLTTSVYIGSAIYTAGIQGVMRQFGVSEVAALLGLTLFVLGYSLGPMLWVSSASFLTDFTMS